MRLKKSSASGWCLPDNDLIYTQPGPPDPDLTFNNFGLYINANHSGDIAVGLVDQPTPDHANLGIKVFTHQPADNWTDEVVFINKKTSYNHRYGSAVVGFDNFLFVNAYYDGTIKSSAGAVYSYIKQGTTWTRTGKILPVVKNKYDDVFGSAIACNGDYLAIGATGFEPKGKTFIYKKTNPDWSSPQLVQTLEIPASELPTNSSGNLAMSHDWLVIAFGKEATGGDGNRVALGIFKFNGSSWDYFQSVVVGGINIFNKTATPAIDIDGETIITNGLVIERDAAGKWATVAQLYPSDPESIQIDPTFTYLVSNGSEFGTSVDVDGNNIYIGAPRKDYNGIWDVGAVYVYPKIPGTSWTSRQESAKILPRVKIAGELFGYSAKAFGNTLIAGAPGDDFNTNNTARNLPGRSYIFQSKDYEWKDVIPVEDFTGDTFIKDYYGIAVNIDSTDFFIGSSIEDNTLSKLAGSVYVTTAPPVLQLQAPVCIDKGTITLKGYPFGGVWSGPGIINASKGIVDLRTAGVGTHLFTYVSPSCYYEGKLSIEIKPAFTPTFANGPDFVICDKGKSSTVITVQPDPLFTYQWDYRLNPGDDYTALDISDNSYTATKPGQYQITISNGFCVQLLVASVVKQEIAIVIDPIPSICNSAPVQFSATPAGGTWTGLVISGNTFNPVQGANGTYPITYNYTSPAGCIFSKTTNIKVDKITVPSYTKINNVCENGSALLSINSPVTGATYTWQFKRSGSSAFETLVNNQSQPQLVASENGTYQLSITNSSNCFIQLSPFLINDQFSPDISPKASSIETCGLKPVSISVKEGTKDIYAWYYSESPSGSPEKLSTTSSQLEIKKTGYYQAEIKRNNCEAWGDKKFIRIIPADTIFIPNVFTPNGDHRNDVFKIFTTLRHVDLQIINRGGKEVYRGSGLTGWTGEDFPSGVYFWSAAFIDCSNQPNSLKGQVQLIR